MIVYLAGYKLLDGYYRRNNISMGGVYVLSSFMEWRGGKAADFVRSDKHILDSGAFSVISKPEKFGVNFDWDAYCNDYIRFINENHQRLFFELDIDDARGLPKVEYYREKIHAETGVAPIPVWHPGRKERYFWKCAEQYPYVSIGALERQKTSPEMLAVMSRLIDIAHKNGAKIHGLGFTATDKLPMLHFDSVDSTTWNAGRFGTTYTYLGNGRMHREPYNPSRRVSSHMKLQDHNFRQWVAYQRWALHNI